MPMGLSDGARSFVRCLLDAHQRQHTLRAQHSLCHNDVSLLPMFLRTSRKPSRSQGRRRSAGQGPRHRRLVPALLHAWVALPHTLPEQIRLHVHHGRAFILATNKPHRSLDMSAAAALQFGPVACDMPQASLSGSFRESPAGCRSGHMYRSSA